MAEQHRVERQKLETGQNTRWIAETRARSERINKGLRGVLDRLTGKRVETERQNITEAHAALRRDREQRQALVEAQLTDRRSLQIKIKAVRAEHAELLNGLRTDRRTYHALANEDQSVSTKPKPSRRHTSKEPFERAAAMRAPNRQPETSTPSQTRLQRLKSGKQRNQKVDRDFEH